MLEYLFLQFFWFLQQQIAQPNTLGVIPCFLDFQSRARGSGWFQGLEY